MHLRIRDELFDKIQETPRRLGLGDRQMVDYIIRTGLKLVDESGLHGFEDFLGEWCVRSPNRKVTRFELYAEYQKRVPKDQQVGSWVFAKNMRCMGFDEGATRGVKCWKGIGLKYPPLVEKAAKAKPKTKPEKENIRERAKKRAKIGLCGIWVKTLQGSLAHESTCK